MFDVMRTALIAGRGSNWDEWPEDIRVRQVPEER
jgi:hypothetical protein